MLYDYGKQRNKTRKRQRQKERREEIVRQEKMMKERQTGPDRENCKVETREAGQKMKVFIKRTKERIITGFTVCGIFFTQLLHSTAEVLTLSDFLKG